MDTEGLIFICPKLTPAWSRHCIARGRPANPGKSQTWRSLLSPCSPLLGHGVSASPAQQNDQQSLPESTVSACSYLEMPKCRGLNPAVDGQGQPWPHASSPCLVGWGLLRAFLRAILSPGRTNHVKNSNSLKRVRSLHRESQVCSDGHLESAGGSWYNHKALFEG